MAFLVVVATHVPHKMLDINTYTLILKKILKQSLVILYSSNSAYYGFRQNVAGR
jgi:hypothetical protein